MIDGKTCLVGLLGWPVEHSRSPALHNAVFEALGLNWRYVPLPVAPGQVEAAVRGLAALGFCGANVTVPHKETVLPLVDALAPEAAALGAINTLVIEREGNAARIVGHNTDAPGFIAALRAGGFAPEGKRIVVLGAGGAARAIVYGLRQAGAARITLLNRTLERAQILTALAGDGAEALPLTAEALIETCRAAELLVNTTSVGMWPHVADSLWPASVPIPPGLTVFDLVYKPLETRLLRQARQSGARGMDGLGMLICQAALASALWTGQDAGVIAGIMQHQIPGDRRENVLSTD